jgi:hypothetical protein
MKRISYDHMNQIIYQKIIKKKEHTFIYYRCAVDIRMVCFRGDSIPVTVETRADHNKNCDIQHEGPNCYHCTFSFWACLGKLQNASYAMVCGLTKQE